MIPNMHQETKLRIADAYEDAINRDQGDGTNLYAHGFVDAISALLGGAPLWQTKLELENWRSTDHDAT